ncbi:MAG TPA: hypothetical protein VF857_10400 [Spirochaetota bacterium]
MSLSKGIERRVKQHVYAKEHDFFAIIQPGFEEICSSDIFEAGGIIISSVEGGIEFRSDIETMWKTHLTSRGITRILMRLMKFKVIYFEKLFAKLEEIPWELHLDKDRSIDFSVTAVHSRLYHSGRIESECRSAIISALSRIHKDKGSIIVGGDDAQLIHIRLEDDICTVSLDCTGEPLYRRGFRTLVEKAPLRETLAAMILRYARIEQYEALCDPMCGSGIIPIEGALMAQGVPPGIRRTFAFEKWPGHSSKGFEYTKKVIREKMSTFPLSIYASDINDKAVETSRLNCSDVLFQDIKIQKRDFFDLKLSDFPEKKILFAMNPPYGERLAAGDNADTFYHKIGEKLKDDFSECGYAVIIPGTDFEKSFGLRYDRKIIFMNGGIRVALLVRDGK